jgi:hypothetical protein
MLLYQEGRALDAFVQLELDERDRAHGIQEKTLTETVEILFTVVYS